MLWLRLYVNPRRRHQYGVVRFDHEELDRDLAHCQVPDDLHKFGVKFKCRLDNNILV